MKGEDTAFYSSLHCSSKIKPTSALILKPQGVSILPDHDVSFHLHIKPGDETSMGIAPEELLKSMFHTDQLQIKFLKGWTFWSKTQ